MADHDLGTELAVLVRKCRRGDSAAWEKLVRLTQGIVYSVPRRMHLSADDSADVFQNTYSALYRSLDHIENPETIAKWLTVCASRESYRIIRTSKVSKGVDVDQATLEQVVADEDASAEDQLQTEERASHLRLAMNKLQDRCKKLLTMLYLQDDVSYDVIGAELSMPIGSIGPTRARCLEKLRSLVQKADFFD